jgi:hypothetical protein
MTAPRLFGVPARDVPVVAVIRRGPSSWCQLGRWTVGAEPTYESGSWLRATVYPQRCALSPDGRWLSYFALGGPARWAAGGTYVAVSRLPWARALAAWGTGGTWTLGAEFRDDRSVWEVGDPDEGDPAALRERYGLGWVRPVTYAAERRAGWVESPSSPPYDPADVWEIRRASHIVMQRPRPGGHEVLSVRGALAAYRSGDARRHGPPDYRLDDEPLPGVQWADWSPDGDLLVATADGRLQVRQIRQGDNGGIVGWEIDLSGLSPDPQPPPVDAERW